MCMHLIIFVIEKIFQTTIMCVTHWMIEKKINSEELIIERYKKKKEIEKVCWTETCGRSRSNRDWRREREKKSFGENCGFRGIYRTVAEIEKQKPRESRQWNFEMALFVSLFICRAIRPRRVGKSIFVNFFFFFVPPFIYLSYAYAHTALYFERGKFLRITQNR